jgi:hypothetical protein
MSNRNNTSHLQTGKTLSKHFFQLPYLLERYRVAAAFCHCLPIAIGMLLLLPLLLLPLFTHAQFIRLNFDIPPKAGLSEYIPFEAELSTDDKTGLQLLEGSTMFTISAAENLHVLVRARVSETFMNEDRESQPLAVVLDYRNDGQRPVQRNLDNYQTGNTREKIYFPLSNSGLLINNIRGHPPLLQAWVIVCLSFGLPANTDITFRSNIHLEIEYN